MKKENKKVKKSKVISTTIILFLLVVGICFSFIPIFKNLNFGLDLQGGFEVLYKVESIDGSKMTKEKLTATYKTLSKRIDSLGVSEPEIILEGTDKIRVKLAGVTDKETARKQLSTVATLSFRDTSDNLLMTSDVLKRAKIGADASGNPAVSLEVKDKDKFYDVTNRLSKKQDKLMVIWLDYVDGTNSYQKDSATCGSESSNCLSAATVSEGFASDVIIQGNFTDEEVANLVDLINSGSLPSKVTELSSKTVGASFGDETLSKTLVAGIIGISLIILLLLFVYHFAGFISSVAIVLYTFLVFFIFWLIGGVLTLPGIAALVLGIGMAVDANVITFSRIKDELYSGKSLKHAFKEGSKTSLHAIMDSNITTLLVAFIMFYFGESSVKGFATVLIITVLVTMFTMVFITRILLNIFVKTGFFDDKLNFFIKVKQEDVPNISKNESIKYIPFQNVNFLKHTKLFAGLSILIILVGSVLFFVKGFHLSVDYKSGSDITISTKKEVTKNQIKENLKELKLNDDEISISDKEVAIKVKNVLKEDKIAEVENYFEEKYDAKVNISVVSNVVKQELVKNACISVLLAILGIILYISFRFKFSYALSSVIALAHDVLVIFDLFLIFDLEISTMFIAAILAIIGYSINDTIVCFDRIRENIKKSKKNSKESLEEICNKSIQETFVRTIYTTITTLLPILTLIAFGSSGILTFNLAMLFGLISGTYSSIFIATSLFILLEKKNIGKNDVRPKKQEEEIEEKKIKGVNC